MIASQSPYLTELHPAYDRLTYKLDAPGFDMILSFT
jgi:hypothetical protein